MFLCKEHNLCKLCAKNLPFLSDLIQLPCNNSLHKYGNYLLVKNGLRFCKTIVSTKGLVHVENNVKSMMRCSKVSYVLGGQMYYFSELQFEKIWKMAAENTTTVCFDINFVANVFRLCSNFVIEWGQCESHESHGCKSCEPCKSTCKSHSLS